MFNLLAGWALMAALYVVFVRGNNTPDPVRAAGFTYRRKVEDRFGLLPPSRQPIGLLLWAITMLGFAAAIVFFLIGDRYIGASSGAMIGSFLLTLWRDNQWLKQQPDYQAALAALKSDD